jgi:ABC-type uncharacterized transport system substrate-binding protein
MATAMLAAQACGGDQAAALRIILRGAKPNESGGSVSAKFELVINLKSIDVPIKL